MIRTTRSAGSIRAGDALPVLERTFTAVDLVAYGAATWDWHRLHYDIDYAKSRNLPGPIIDGQAFGALLARAAMEWAGPRAFMTRLAFRVKSMAFAGATLRAAGSVVAIEPVQGGHKVVLAQQLTAGERVVAESTTELRLPE